MDTDEEPSSLSLSSETKAGGIEGCISCIVVGLRLANFPGDHQSILDRWKDSHSTKPFVSAIFGTRQTLMEKEREYRDTAIAIAQIGIGVGGMLLGLLGLLLSFILSYVVPTNSYLKTDHHISAVPQGSQSKPVLESLSPANKAGGVPARNAK